MKLNEAYEAYKKFKVPSLSEIRDTASEHSKTSFIIIILLVVFLLLALQYIPHYQVAQFNITNQKDLADAENSYRATLAQIFGGIAIAIGLYYTWRRIGIAEEDLKATQENLKVTQENLKVSQESQITDRFIRAVEQLGSDKIEISLGGIYALERIANESDKDYWPIMEILTAYVRKNSSIELVEIQDKVSFDIQAILTVIARRKYTFGDEEYFGLDLQGTCLRKADFFAANLKKANIAGTDLKGADLRFANLIGANLTLADLMAAKLEYTDFLLAKLEETTIAHANLANANLRGAKNLTVDQLSKVHTLFHAQLDPKLEAELRAKDFGYLLDDEPK
jgi:hypothetical protein